MKYPVGHKFKIFDQHCEIFGYKDKQYTIWIKNTRRSLDIPEETLDSYLNSELDDILFGE